MADIVRLEDIMEYYPPQNDPTLQAYIARLQEFIEKRSLPKEPTPSRDCHGVLPIGQSLLYYNNQEQLKRYLRVYGGVLVIDDAGTGKTCSVTSIIEYIDDESDKRDHGLPADENALQYDNKALILVSGKNQKEEIRKQIVCVCSCKGKYDENIEKEYAEDLAKAITIRIRRRYEIHHFEKFVTKTRARISKLAEESYNGDLDRARQEILDEYANRVVWIDEGHRLITTEESELEEVAPVPKEERIVRKLRKADVLDFINEFIHDIRNAKRIVTTATPLAGKASNVVPIMNLILPREERLFPGDETNRRKLLEVFNGRISYVKALQTVVVPQYQSNYESEFVPEEKGAVEAFVRDNRLEGEMDLIYEMYYTEMSRLQRDEFEARPSDRPVITRSLSIKATGETDDIAVLRTLSPGVVSMCQLIYSKQDYGTVLIFSPFVEYRLGGVYFIAGVLEAMGYEQYIPREETKKPGVKTMPKTAYCSGSSGRELSMVANPHRYAIITGDTTELEIRDILGVMNSEANVLGDYISILIISPTASEGISVSHVCQIHLAAPTFTWSEMYQAQMRGIRVTSQNYLISWLKEQKLLVEPPKVPVVDDPDLRGAIVVEGATIGEHRFVVKIFRHCRYYFDNNGDFVSPELYYYLYAKQKDRDPERIVEMMRMCAYNCLANPSRSIGRCINSRKPLEPVITTNWDLLYSSVFKQELRYRIRELAREVLPATINDLLLYLDVGVLEKCARTVIDEIVNDDEPIKDIFGYTAYIRRSGDSLYLARNYRDLYDEWLYGYQLQAYTAKPLYKILQEMYARPSRMLYDDLVGYGEGRAKFTEEEAPYLSALIQSGGREGMVCTLENAIVAFEEIYYSAMTRAVNDYDTLLAAAPVEEEPTIRDNKDAYIDTQFAMYEAETGYSVSDLFILAHFSLVVFKVPKLTDEQTKALGEKTKTKKKTTRKLGEKRGRPKKPVESARLTDLPAVGYDEPTMTRTGYVVIHILDSLLNDSISGYNIIPSYAKVEGALRIYDPSTSTWETVKPEGFNPTTFRAYSYILRARVAKLYNAYERALRGTGIYGLMFPTDDILRVIDKTTQREFKSEEIDKRAIMRGQKCSGLGKVIVAYHLAKIDRPRVEAILATKRKRSTRTMREVLDKDAKVMSIDKNKLSDASKAEIMEGPDSFYMRAVYHFYVDKKAYPGWKLCELLHVSLAAQGLLMDGLSVCERNYPYVPISAILEAPQ
jgi:hypothetical protein